ncbi:rhombosortase [Psychromonas sp. MME2]|uniref:rhombosortase n=1 Tax=Psychromonas sp. MME2 TaxID=3231033 RepID=UPI00339C1D31
MRNLAIETTLIISISILVYIFEPQASQLLAYYHNAITHFEYWRFISATFCHTNFNHLGLNLIGLLITLGLFIDTFKEVKVLPLLLFNSLFIGLCLFLLEPTVTGYVGLSGVLHGLFSYGVISDIKNKDRWGYLLGTGFVIKIFYEQIFGAQQSTIDLIAAPVLVNAHLYGAIAGLIYYFLLAAINRKRQPKLPLNG